MLSVGYFPFSLSTLIRLQKKSLCLAISKVNREDVIESIKLSHRIAWVFVVSFIALIAFWQISKSVNDWTWFARSGSILVCIGVITASYDIKGRMEKSNAPNTYSSQTIILEALIVIVGTLVWGFGDLVGKII